MKLIFVKDKICSFASLVEPIIYEFAKNNNLQLIKHVRTDETTPKMYDINISPVLFFVENENILGKINGYFGEKLQYEMYEKELKYVLNPELRPIQRNKENEK